MTHPERQALLAAATVWAGVVLGGGALPGWRLAALAAACSIILRRRPALLALLIVALAAGFMLESRERATLTSQVPLGRVVVAGTATTDSFDRWGGRVFFLEPLHFEVAGGWRRWSGPRLVVETEAEVVAGTSVTVVGKSDPSPGRLRGKPYAGRLVGADVTAGSSVNPLAGGGNWIRERVTRQVKPTSEPAAALLAGLLVGDTASLSEADMDSVRRAGLAHLVAVSGSNVALFLAGWWALTAPLTMGPRRRLAVGFLGLTLFVVATRWEPSVLRAAAMVAVLLGGRLAGFIVTPWSALGTSIAGLLLISPELAGQVGFQLSVAATAGVLVGAGVGRRRRPRWLWTGLGVSLGAQAAVAPLILLYFDRLPLLAPVTNLVAVPVAGAATALGGIGALSGSDLVIGAALIPARIVLGLARWVDAAPQLDLFGLLLAAGIGGLLKVRALRPLAIGALGLFLVVQVLPIAPVRAPTVVFLDVGQGDATLLLSPAGGAVLVDGGPPDAGLAGKLRERGVGHLALVVATHGDLDHIGGLRELAGSVPAVEFWHPPVHQATDPLLALGEQFRTAGTAVRSPAVGERVVVGGFTIDVVGPVRRYQGDNDGSLVLRIEAGSGSLLVAGDVEAVAQADLRLAPVDVLLVPHHGAATSDRDWLAALSPGMAVISVGDNDFGHPSEEIIDALAHTGVTVRRTDREGDVVIRMGRDP